MLWSIVGAAAIVVALAAAAGVGIVVLWTGGSDESASAAGASLSASPTVKAHDETPELLRWHGTGSNLAAGRKVELKATTTESGLGIEVMCKAPKDVQVRVLVDGEQRNCGGGSGAAAPTGEHVISVSAAHGDGSAYELDDGDLEVDVFVFEFDAATWDGP